MPDIAEFVPGGILHTDRWHRETNDGTCSRCSALLSRYEVPLLLSSTHGNDMLIYCERCLCWPNQEIPAPSVAGCPEGPSTSP